jgi:hypothetical protein
MKPNFNGMTKSELRAYVLEHRDDLDAIEALFSLHSSSESMLFHLPSSEEEWQQQIEQIRPILEQDQERERQKQQNGE